MKQYRVNDLRQKDDIALANLSSHQWERGCECAIHLCEMRFLQIALRALENVQQYGETFLLKRDLDAAVAAMGKLLGRQAVESAAPLQNELLWPEEIRHLNR